MEWFKNNLFNYENWQEWLGLLAAAIVLVSFLMNDEKKIRLINIAGAVVFVIYGLLRKSASVWLMNLGLIVVHIVKCAKLKKNSSAENNCVNEVQNGMESTDGKSGQK